MEIVVLMQEIGVAVITNFLNFSKSIQNSYKTLKTFSLLNWSVKWIFYVLIYSK